MPKQPGGISKFQRIEALREVLDRWGKLNKNQIDEMVAAKLGCDSDQIARALYRDLEVLESLNQIRSVHYSRDGRKIEDFDPEKHKNTLCEYSVPEAEFGVRGSKRLFDVGIALSVSPRLMNSISIGDGTPSLNGAPYFTLYFQAGGKAQSMVVDLEALPFKICIARNSDDLNISSLALESNQVLGKRAIGLFVPSQSVSSFRSSEKPGHVLLEFEQPASFTIQDLDSKNGTFYEKLDVQTATTQIQKRHSGEKATSTHQIDLVKTTAPPRVPVGEKISLTLPAKVFASLDFSMIVQGPN